MNKQKRRCIRHIDKGWYGYLFIAPFFVVFAVFGLYPIIYTFFLSFQKWDGLSPITFLGLSNYRRLFTDRVFYLTVCVQLPAADGMCAGAVSPVHLQPRSGNEIFPCGLLPA